MSQVDVLGIRHHGPGSARAVVAALESARPDVVLIEGPSDADPLLAFAADPGLRPPVALFAYDPDEPGRSAFWPLAVFSPEWQAIAWAAAHDVPVRFCDLPARTVLARDPDDADGPGDAAALDAPEGPDAAATPPADAREPAPVELARTDPIAALAGAAGYEDPEAWWDDVVEARGDAPERFAAIAEAMAALRSAATAAPPTDRSDQREQQREAFMRQQIRAASKAGAERIAVVCGAWHAPALAAPLPPASADAAILRGLPRRKVALTWVPWTHSRLAAASGYGAGVTSPGWYHHLFTSPSRPVERWLTRVAAVLREEDLPVSSAHVIESVRLAGALATLRGRPGPGLAELSEATLAVMCDADPLIADLVTRRLVVGEALGSVPDEVPQLPLETDLVATTRRLRLKREALERVLDLDLRKEIDGARSRLLHRLRVLDIPWGERTADAHRSKGTFRETWRLTWRPELAIAVADAARWGTTVQGAAIGVLRERAATCEDLAVLAQSVDAALLADLGGALGDLLAAVERRAALDPDVGRLMAAVPALVRTARYGDVRGTDAASVRHVVESLLVRVCLGVGPAAAGIDVDAARDLAGHLAAVHAAVRLYDDDATTDRWLTALAGAGDRGDVAPLVAGWTARTLLDAGRRGGEETGARLRLALSRGAAADEKAAWVEGFLGAGGELLVHDRSLLALLDEWVTGLSDAAFVTVLPLLRRTFGRLEEPVRRAIGARVRTLGGQGPGPGDDGPAGWDVSPERAARGMAATYAIWGVNV